MSTSTQTTTLDQLAQQFATPQKAFSPVPIWWWSGDALEVERMRWQIDQLVAQGVHNAVVLNLAPTGPTHGSLSDAPHMTTPEWWDIWEALCEQVLRPRPQAERLTGGPWLDHFSIRHAHAYIMGIDLWPSSTEGQGCCTNASTM